MKAVPQVAREGAAQLTVPHSRVQEIRKRSILPLKGLNGYSLEFYLISRKKLFTIKTTQTFATVFNSALKHLTILNSLTSALGP